MLCLLEIVVFARLLMLAHRPLHRSYMTSTSVNIWMGDHPSINVLCVEQESRSQTGLNSVLHDWNYAKVASR